MSRPTDPHRGSLEFWLHFIQSLLWPALAIAVLLMFGSDITRLLKHITHLKTGWVEADLDSSRIGLSIRDVLLSMAERHDESRGASVGGGEGGIDSKTLEQMLQLFGNLELEKHSLAGKRILWLNSRPSAENLDLANAFAALGILVFHARTNCTAKRLLSQDSYSVIITNMYRASDKSDTAHCARDIPDPPNDENKYAGGFEFLEYLSSISNRIPVDVYSGWSPSDVSQEEKKLHVSMINNLPPETYAFVLKTLSEE